MQILRAALVLMMLVAMTGVASAQMNFSAPVFTSPNFSPSNFQAPQWSPRQGAIPQTTVRTNFSVVQFTNTQFTPMQAQALPAQPIQFVNPTLNGSSRTSRPSVGASRVTPSQSARAARTSLSRFSQGLGSL